jgi:hypothetical protein
MSDLVAEQRHGNSPEVSDQGWIQDGSHTYGITPRAVGSTGFLDIPAGADVHGGRVCSLVPTTIRREHYDQSTS